jgi:hypothetical protein
MKFNKEVLQLLLAVIAFLVLPQTNWSDWLTEPGDRYGEHHLLAGERLIVLAKNVGSDEVIYPEAVPVGARTISGTEVPQWLLERGIPGSSYAVLEVKPDTHRERWVGGQRFETGTLTLATPSEVRFSWLALAGTALAFAYLGLSVADFLGHRVPKVAGIERERRQQ